MQPKYPAVTAGRMDIPGNDSKHNKRDLNQGGGPSGRAASIPHAARGGTSHQGRDRVHVKASMPAGRGSAGNPASRGATPGSFNPETRNPNRGGGVQTKKTNIPRQFGKPGQAGVPGGNPTQPPPGAGNTSGKSYQLIAGRFKRAAMGAKATKQSGSYGGPPVSTNT